MNINLSEKLKNLRKENNVSQEKTCWVSQSIISSSRQMGKFKSCDLKANYATDLKAI